MAIATSMFGGTIYAGGQGIGTPEQIALRKNNLIREDAINNLNAQFTTQTYNQRLATQQAQLNREATLANVEAQNAQIELQTKAQTAARLAADPYADLRAAQQMRQDEARYNTELTTSADKQRRVNQLNAQQAFTNRQKALDIALSNSRWADVTGGSDATKNAQSAAQKLAATDNAGDTNQDVVKNAVAAVGKDPSSYKTGI